VDKNGISIGRGTAGIAVLNGPIEARSSMSYLAYILCRSLVLRIFNDNIYTANVMYV
jgi:hypothetical protein